MSRKYARFILITSVLLNIVLVREIVKYEPPTYKSRFYYRIWQTGLLNKKLSLSELEGDSILVILTMGQSNAANSSNSKYKPSGNVLNYYNGNLYQAEEPLIGASGGGGSVWPLLADLLIKNKFCKKVVIVPIAVGSTDVYNWANGECSLKLKNTLNDLKENNIKLTQILWHHGEANNGTSKQVYKENMASILKVIRSYHQDAPFYCAIATFSPLAVKMPNGIDVNIQNAQKEFIEENANVFPGPNTDQLTHAMDRYDAQHFSEFGKMKFAELWYASLLK